MCGNCCTGSSGWNFMVSLAYLEHLMKMKKKKKKIDDRGRTQLVDFGFLAN